MPDRRLRLEKLAAQRLAQRRVFAQLALWADTDAAK
jgi:hypothetical protein